MTWAKFADDFPDQCGRAGLSDNAFRVHVEGIIWAMRRENGGRFSTRDLVRSSDAADPEAGAAELVAVGFWEGVPEGWQVIHHMEHQPEPEVIRARRGKDADRQRKHRRNAAGLDPDPPVEPTPSRRDKRRDSRRDHTHDVTPPVTRDPGRVGAGRVETGKDALDGTNDVTGADDADGRTGTADASPPPTPGDPTCTSCAHPLWDPRSIAAGLCSTHRKSSRP